ncbi:hypothetical protein CK203_027449 [Vitis vinifera]|uniref:Uncharacterized protein n=2 Tax=Vitis vinifera TaxID=29760 RepID=A0A438EA62_VITVI|nr:hypothetical protein CK203_086906 [Vitis vinifera]RVX06179.1 hypothetical protein CK203_027449 [Vitis vinifera]
MQENESLRDFMKRFGQMVLQVEFYNIDAILQIFKWSISPSTLFFESFTKKPLVLMDDLFRRTDKYAMLKDDEDALVLTLGVGNFDVCKILIDLRNSTDLLQMSAYRQMGYSLSTLDNLDRILIGFNGASIVSMGDVILPIQASPVTLNVLFSIVEDLLPYNAIMGGVWLHKMKVISSTYHQMVSYLIEVKQVDLLDSQLAARQYYRVTIESRKIDLAGDKLESSSAKSQLQLQQ